MRTTPHNGYEVNGRSEPVRFVEVPRDPDGLEFGIDPEIARRVMIDVIHDGPWIPAEFLVDGDGRPIPDEAFLDYYWLERDWGASLLAEALCRELGVPGYHNVEMARVLMDFGRFPGLTQRDAGHLDRFALNYPFSELLNFNQKQCVLEGYYDRISEHFDAGVRSAITKIAIHTYDRRNDSGTVRPEVSVLTRATSYQHESEMPFGVFDPMYPDVLAEYTADRILRDRISLTFEKAGFPVAHNYPYTLPDGSIEVRAQVWNFFRYLRRRYGEHAPRAAASRGHELVWKMLLDTNLRSSESEILRSYLYMFRRVPAGRADEFDAARIAYEKVYGYLRENEDDIVQGYRRSPERLSTLGIEVRKDLLFDFEGAHVPLRPRPEGADEVASILARAIHTYFTRDRPRSDHHRVRLRPVPSLDGEAAPGDRGRSPRATAAGSPRSEGSGGPTPPRSP